MDEGKKLRYKMWLECLSIWADYYGISKEKACELLFVNAPENISANDPRRFAEGSEFAAEIMWGKEVQHAD